LAFSYWIDNLGFITEGKLAAIFIKPFLGVSNWPVIYYTFPRQLGNRIFLLPLPRLKKKLPHHHYSAITASGRTPPWSLPSLQAITALAIDTSVIRASF
jgi:hypothetical protein